MHGQACSLQVEDAEPCGPWSLQVLREGPALPVAFISSMGCRQACCAPAGDRHLCAALQK